MFNKLPNDGVQSEEENKYAIAKQLFLQDKYQEAITILQVFINSDKPYDVETISYAYDLLGQCHSALNEDKHALNSYKAAIGLNSECASAWHNMGLLNIKLAQLVLETNLFHSQLCFNAAQSFINNALIISGDNPMFLHSVAGWYKEYIGVLERAIAEEDAFFQETITNHYRFAIKYYKKAFATCDINDLNQRAIISENLTNCLAEFGDHLYRNAHYNDAEQIYFETIGRNPNSLSAINQLGMSLFKQERFSEAREYFALILDKTDDQQEQADAWLNIACAYRFEKKWDKAAEALKLAKELAPEDTAIDDEIKELADARAAAALVSASQTLYADSKPDNQTSQELNFQYQ